MNKDIDYYSCAIYNYIVHIIDFKRFHEVLKEKGYRSIGELADSLGIHRNTIHHYLSGHGVFPECLEKIIRALDLKPGEILVEKDRRKSLMIEPIAPLVDQLHKEFACVTFVFFGSRSRGTSQKYSDWDIGVFSKDGLSHSLYRKILRRKDDLAEDLPFFIELINLNRADNNFLRTAGKSWIFLSGRLSDWIELQRKVLL